MKNPIIKFFSLSLTLLFFYGCNFSAPEPIVSIDEDDDANVLSIPEGFDFSTYHDVVINITENDAYAKYDVYAYTDELYDAGIETFENEAGEIVTETLFKSGMLDNLIFSGVAKNGVLSQTINLPKFYTKIYIRRNEQLSFSSTIKDIVKQKVDYNSNEAKGSVKSKSTNNVTDYLSVISHR